MEIINLLIEKIKNKNILILGWWIVVILFIILFIFLFLKPSDSPDEVIVNNENQSSNNSITNQETWDYYETNSPTVSTPLPENFEEKLEEEGKINWFTLKFDKNWFENDKRVYRFNLQSNIKILVDASNTWLPEWSILKLSIPWSSLNSQINIPWRYTYSVFFNEVWEQPIVISGDWIPNWKITKYIQIK